MSDLHLRISSDATAQIRRALLQRREELGLKQREVARRMGVAQSHLSELESGTVQNPWLATVIAWAEALDYSVEMIFAEVG